MFTRGTMAAGEFWDHWMKMILTSSWPSSCRSRIPAGSEAWTVE